MRRVLFVCVANTCRSPMAAALAREVLGPGAQVESAGIDASHGSEATPEAVEVMSEHGLDIASHRSRPARSVDLGSYDVVVALTPSIAEHLRRLGRSDVEVMNVPDPLGRGLKAYRDTAAAMLAELHRIFGGGSGGPPSRGARGPQRRAS